MERYGCLVLGVIIALVILFVIVFLWSGWLNRPVGPSPARNSGLAAPPALTGCPHPKPAGWRTASAGAPFAGDSQAAADLMTLARASR